MIRKWVLGLLVGTSLVSALAVALPKRGAGCPKRSPKDGAPCSRKVESCVYRCEGEGHRDRDCTCAKDEKGKLRWTCSDIGPTCVL